MGVKKKNIRNVFQFSKCCLLYTYLVGHGSFILGRSFLFPTLTHGFAVRIDRCQLCFRSKRFIPSVGCFVDLPLREVERETLSELASSLTVRVDATGLSTR